MFATLSRGDSGKPIEGQEALANAVKRSKKGFGYSKAGAEFG